MVVLPFLYQQQCTQGFCRSVQQSQPHITSRTDVALLVLVATAAAAAAAAAAAGLVIRGACVYRQPVQPVKGAATAVLFAGAA